jgi:hypothetical protein
VRNRSRPSASSKPQSWKRSFCLLRLATVLGRSINALQDQSLSRSSKNCRILNIEESKIWLSPSSHRSTDERDTPRMAVIHIVSLSELRIADTAPKLSYGKQNYRQLRKTLKNAGDLGGRTKSTCISWSVRTRSRVRVVERGILNARDYLLELERNLWSRRETDCGLTNQPTSRSL